MVSDKREGSEKSEDYISLKAWRDTLVASSGEVEKFSSSVIWDLLGTSVASIVIGSLGGLADERLVDADLSAWDNSLAPKANWDAIVDGCKKGIKLEVEYLLKREDKLIYLSNWWFCCTKSLPSGGFLSYTFGFLAFWRLICEYCWGTWGFHQLFQSGCSWSYSWGWTWWIIFYAIPFPVHAWWIKFGILQRNLLDELIGEFVG